MEMMIADKYANYKNADALSKQRKNERNVQSVYLNLLRFILGGSVVIFSHSRNVWMQDFPSDVS